MTSQLYDVATSNIIQAADIDQCVDMLNTLLGFTNTIILNGATAGTATLYEILQGPIKIVVVSMSGFRNGGTPGQTIALPTAFVKGVAVGKNTGTGTFQLLSAGSAINIFVHTAVSNATIDGPVSSQTNVKQNLDWHADVPFDTIYFNGSDASTHNGYIWIVGS